MPRLADMRPGDLISDLDDDDHFMMWVGGDLALVENVDATKYCGVFRHSDTKITQRIRLAQEAASRKKTSSPASLRSSGASGSDEDDEAPEGFAVFRCRNAAIARKAADFAIAWSMGTDHGDFVAGVAKAKATGEQFQLPIKFNQERLTHDRQQAFDQWDARSLLRALRVLARHDSGAPLSVKGWTCSSFVTYCFQAAALACLFHDGPIRGDLLLTIARSGSQGFLSIKNELNLIEMVLSDTSEVVRQLIPKGLLVDGKAVDASSLKDFLALPDNGFDKLGDITA